MVELRLRFMVKKLGWENSENKFPLKRRVFSRENHNMAEKIKTRFFTH